MIPRKQNIVFGFILFEFILLNLCIFAVLFFKVPEALIGVVDHTLFNDFLSLLLISNVTWIGVILLNGDPNFYTSYSFRKRIKFLFINSLLFIGATSTLTIFFKVDHLNRTMLILPVLLFSFFNLFFFRFVIEFYFRRNKRNFNSNILFIGNGHKWKETLEFTQKIRPLGYTNVGYLYHGKRQAASMKYGKDLNVLGPIEDLPSVLSKQKVDEIFVTDNYLKEKEMKSVIELADFSGVRINLIPEQSIQAGNKFMSYDLDGLPLFKYRASPLDNFNNFLLKRAFDFFFSLSVLILLSPVFLLIALLIKLESKGAVLYTPMRKGEAGKSFKCYKFRSMSACDDPLNGTRSTEKNDPRITRIGKYLRKLDLDELPQFFNVLKGDMSVVGPRPHRVNLQDDFRKTVNNYMVRHYVKPGITGWAQVNGWRGPTQTLVQKKERIKHDLKYIESWNFILDIRIIFLTVFGKKTRHNAF